MKYTIDIDTGGTFTDGFFVGDDHVEMVKVPTTPHDLTVCFLKCIEAGADCFGVSVEDFLYDTEIIRFSNTIGTNTIIQRDGSKIGLLLTSGNEALAPTKDTEGKSPLVSEDMIAGIDEAVSESGEVIKEVHESHALAKAQRLIDRGARCLVVALTNSELNPANERVVRKVVKQEYPGDFLGSVPVFLSSDISGRSGELERVNAAVLNAYIHAKLVRLLYKAGEELRRRLYQKNLFIVHNNGAVARVARTRAINTYNSGPVAGLLGARLIGELYGQSDLISADMGGTSFDIGYVKNGVPSYMLRPDVEGFTVNVPMIAIRAIGAGGGSIASVNDGQLQVGPQSAGALPGPVCFDLGGSEPAVADADVALGILDPKYFLGGQMKLNKDKAMDVMEKKVAKPLGVSVEAAALEIKKQIDRAMGMAVNRQKQDMGGDADPLLVFYGGAGPAHCCGIAETADLKKIVITPFSAVFSAFSSSNMDVGHLYYRRVNKPLTMAADLSEIDSAVSEMWREADRDMRGEGFSHDQVVSGLELLVQTESGGSEIKVAVDTDFYKDPDKLAALIKEVGEVLPGALIINTVSLMVRAQVAHYKIEKVDPVNDDAKVAQKGVRKVFMETGYAEVPVYDREKLSNGHGIMGPALVESAHTTIYVSTGWRMTVDPYKNAVLEGV
ncbi:MAG: hydantoinase/oxoprolinase family protein [Deltaproteobacteria bacterium]|nr:hydantoinase/oxoprolinase family protein [Deltaproteobacteria bacterium]